jgi:hypothetical protein
LRGTKPFTINGSQVDANTFGAGTCVETITDLTGRPDGFSPKPSLSNPNSPLRCSAGAVTLSVTAGGGTTTAMTYTWTVGGTPYTTTTNSYTTGSLLASAAYTVKVKNANDCESNTVNGNITVRYPATTGNAPDASCGCATGLQNCSGVCLSNCGATENGNCGEDYQACSGVACDCPTRCAQDGYRYYRIVKWLVDKCFCCN